MLKRHFKQLLTLIVKSPCFVFNNVYFKQIDGVAMGSPLGPTFANLFLVSYENIWLGKCPHQSKPKYYRRYVNDIFLMFEKKDHVKKFLKYMNSCHQNIKFTIEEEHNNEIAFLDISITGGGNELQTSLFRKKTFSVVYLNLNSHLPSEHKKGLFQTLLYRAYNTNLRQEIVYLKSVWQKNSFPLFFIDKCVHKFLNSLFLKRHHLKPSSEKKEVIISLEFLGKLSLQVKKQLNDIFRSCHKYVKLTVVFKSPNRIRNVFVSKNSYARVLDQKYFINIRATLAIVSTLVKLNDIF